ncbi:MAG: hypothetical protein ACFBSD_05760 [Paracoccaceae bacterium]
MTHLRIYALGGLLAVAALGLVFWALDLLPPDRATMAAGQKGGGYDAIAEQYAQILARDGIRLEIVETAGSVENGRRLANGTADTALVQGGVPVPTIGEARPVEAIAAIFPELVLLVTRADSGVSSFPPRISMTSPA